MSGGRISVRAAAALSHAALATTALLSLYPFAFMLATPAKSNDQFYHGYFAPTLPFHWDNYAEVWHATGRFVANSALVTGASVLAVVLIASLAGYAFARWRFRGSDALSSQSSPCS